MAKGGDRKTVKDHKNGKAANDHELEIDGKPGVGDNSFEPSGATIDELMACMDEADDEIESLQEKIKTKTQPERDKIKAARKKISKAREALVSEGYQPIALDVLMGQRRDIRSAQKRAEQLDPDNQKKLKAYQRAWEDFSELPLGLAAVRREGADAH